MAVAAAPRSMAAARAVRPASARLDLICRIKMCCSGIRSVRRLKTAGVRRRSLRWSSGRSLISASDSPSRLRRAALREMSGVGRGTRQVRCKKKYRGAVCSQASEARKDDEEDTGAAAQRHAHARPTNRARAHLAFSLFCCKLPARLARISLHVSVSVSCTLAGLPLIASSTSRR